MNLHIGEIVDSNYITTPASDRAGRPYPRGYAYVRMPWMASPSNPDPISQHPIPVFVGRQHRAGKLDWEPLADGTRVVIAPVDPTPINPLGLAVIAFGPQTDDLYTDYRETATYHEQGGNGGEDRYVNAPTDPVFGNNVDVGRTHEDSRGYGWRTRHPYPGDANRDEADETWPGVTVHNEKRLDNSVVERVVTVTGPAGVFTITVDAVAGTVTIADDTGDEIVLDKPNQKIALTALAEVTVDAPSIKLAGGGAAVARVGDAVQVDSGTHVGTITAGSGAVESG